MIIGVAAGAGAENVRTPGGSEQILTPLKDDLGPEDDICAGGIVVQVGAAIKDGKTDYLSGCFV